MSGHWWIAVMLGAGCYAPSPPTGAPCADGACPSGLVCAAATATCEVPGSSADVDAGPVIANAWRYRVAVTVETTGAVSPITSILLPPTFAYSHAATDGSDIRVGDDDQSNGFELPHLVDTWTPDGTTRLWTRLPAGATGPTTIYVYYGKDGDPVTSTSDFAAVFPNTFRTTADGVLGGSVTYDAFIIEPDHELVVTPEAPLVISAAYVRIAGTLNADAAGYPSATGPGAGGTSTNGGGGGAGHGGTGGLGGTDPTDQPGLAGVAYGMANDAAIDMGSGGGSTDVVEVGAHGGGAITIRAVRLELPGTITAIGGAGTGGARSSGAGAGGGVLLAANSLDVTGLITVAGGPGANGPSAGNDGSGGGGGGRIKLFERGDIVNTAMLIATGGIGGTGGDTAPGQAGSVGSTFVGTSTELPPLPILSAEEAL